MGTKKQKQKRWAAAARLFLCLALLAGICAPFIYWNARNGAGDSGEGKSAPEQSASLSAEDETEPEGRADAEEQADAEDNTASDDADASINEPAKVKGIYVTGPKAGSESFGDLLELVDETELNTMVIDVKNDDGEITFRPGDDFSDLQAASVPYISDIESFMDTLHEHGVYTIAHITCFKDPTLAENEPALALTKTDGTPIVDENGLAWVNPCSEEVWDYLVEVAKLAVSVGFDEIQFDYVRFPIGSDAEEADYGITMDEYTRRDIITEFLTYAVDELHQEGVPVSADVFGTIIGSDTDVRQVGQDYTALGEILDVLSPMVYPSHYGEGVFGLSVPDAYPYETVYGAMSESQKELSEISEENRGTVRPWLQAFTATWVDGHIAYGGDEIRAQIQAVYDAGYEEWILWDSSNDYTADGLLSSSE